MTIAPNSSIVTQPLKGEEETFDTIPVLAGRGTVFQWQGRRDHELGSIHEIQFSLPDHLQRAGHQQCLRAPGSRLQSRVGNPWDLQFRPRPVLYVRRLFGLLPDDLA